MKYIVVHKIKADGGPVIITFHTGASLRRFIIQKDLHPNDYAVFNGEVLKSFEHKSFDLKNLKGE